MIADLLAGAMLGLSVALPFGPVSLLCVQNSIASGARGGLLAGAGASTAHGVFAFAAIAGAGVFAPDLVHWSRTIHLCSAVILATLGVRTLLRRSKAKALGEPLPARAAFLASLLLAVSNPLTVLPYLAVASSVTAAETVAVPHSYWAVPGVVAGAAAWYCTLSLVTALFRSGLPPRLLPRLNLISGTMLLAFGALVALR